MSDWQDISTAPRDGTFVLLYNRAHKETWVLGWTSNSRLFGMDEEEGETDGMWTDAGNKNVTANVCYNDGGYFSFWQPLPTPPKESVWRCSVTSNPCGTDTVREGYRCECKSCRMWEIERGNPPRIILMPTPDKGEG